MLDDICTLGGWRLTIEASVCGCSNEQTPNTDAVKSSCHRNRRFPMRRLGKLRKPTLQHRNIRPRDPAVNFPEHFQLKSDFFSVALNAREMASSTAREG
ncbi:hypothetical protein PsorP6_013441 [Peronosclerospora sorghi]|uniref:Uncharacterized protein n=1 Tax=Peronosclerospora sorghi TaxID=230839 RepID=A0ACC0VGT7_9STRA|nr:hypothetical protein PsorP6_013441 [Peronosclerospora sorghi]